MLALVMFINRMGAMVIPLLGIYMTQALNFSLRNTDLGLSLFGFCALAESWIGGKLTDIKVQVTSLFLTVPLFYLKNTVPSKNILTAV